MTTLTATITTDAAGRLAADSTCTIDGQTIPIPDRVWPAGRLAPARILGAIRSLGYTTKSRDGSLYYDTLALGDGYVTVAVVAA